MLPKTSSSIKRLERKLDGLGKFGVLRVSLGAKLPDLIAVIERNLFRHRKQLLVELANLRDDGLARFRHHVSTGLFRPEPDALLFSARRDLRTVWVRSAGMQEKQSVVNAWLASNAPGTAAVGAPLSVGRLVPDPHSFRAQFAAAILENWRQFAVCQNPECQSRYFLAKRRTQKYCERGPCTAFAQRRYALKWWTRVGSKRRAMRQKSNRRQAKSSRRTRR